MMYYFIKYICICIYIIVIVPYVCIHALHASAGLGLWSQASNPIWDSKCLGLAWRP